MSVFSTTTHDSKPKAIRRSNIVCRIDVPRSLKSEAIEILRLEFEKNGGITYEIIQHSGTGGQHNLCMTSKGVYPALSRAFEVAEALVKDNTPSAFHHLSVERRAWF
ncbi:MAG: hypothetical protein LW865_01830 [Betaproteobacteria bacterium]|jgi:hypothetical protein|nr:hypothetical protein [Rhodocyclaceae bacterium]MCE2722014.1 hypothetical protein [Betaproteobacteria bacterium]